MLSVYDLYDLGAVFKNIRAFPDYSMNALVMLKSIAVLNDRENNNFNQFRTAISSIPSIDSEMYYFVFVKNVYVYFPTLVKNESVYQILLRSCELLYDAIMENNRQKVMDLADCIHNLPVIIVEANFKIPKSFYCKNRRAGSELRIYSLIVLFLH